MGYVFTPEQFEAGKIPTTDDYRKSLAILRRGLWSEFRKGMIYGANINGSTQHNDAGIGSDIDILIVTSSVQAEMNLRRLNAFAMDKTNVPIEFVPVREYLARSGAHNIDGLYVKYIRKYCREGVIGNNPTEVMAPLPSWNSPKQEAIDWSVASLQKFSKRSSILPEKYDELHCDFLEDLIRKPIYSAIDLMRARNNGEYPSKNGNPLSKSECCELFKQEFSQLDSSGLFSVLEMRKKYRKFLQEREGKKLPEYLSLLREIDNMYPVAVEVITKNLTFLFDGKK
ncbi:MAG: hypothetical protein V1731_02035 [Candidatus Aenigmatarchaeota archaeon]